DPSPDHISLLKQRISIVTNPWAVRSARVRPAALEMSRSKGRRIMRIVVMGGTGLIGSKLVKKLGEHGHEVVAAAPSSGVNSLTGEGRADVLRGASVAGVGTNAHSWEDTAVLKFF